MKAVDFKKEFPNVFMVYQSKGYVNPLEVFEQYHFNQPDPDGMRSGVASKDYRAEAINDCLQNKLDFCSTANSIYDLQKKLIKIECPICHSVLTGFGGGGTYGHMHIDYKCECGFHTSLDMPEDGVSISFDKCE